MWARKTSSLTDPPRHCSLLRPRQQGGAFFRSSRVGVRADSNAFTWQSDAFLMARLPVLYRGREHRTPPDDAPRRGFALVALPNGNSTNQSNIQNWELCDGPACRGQGANQKEMSLSSARDSPEPIPQAKPSPRVPSGLLTCDGLAAGQGRTPSA
jgi:hypothetical protein